MKRAVNRERLRELKKSIKKMSLTELHKLITQICINYNEAVMEEVLVILNQEFGFGKIRQQRLIDKLNERIIMNNDKGENNGEKEDRERMGKSSVS